MKKKLDKGYLACQHHLFMTIGVQMAISPPFSKGSDSVQRDVLVVGLGGGGLCTFMHELLRRTRITAVEIDPIMLEVAEQFFELKQDDRLHVVIDDGINFLEKCAYDKDQVFKFNAILFDVDSKDLTLGMSCPPKSFLEQNVIEAVKSLIGKEGIFVLNLVCRDEQLRNNVICDLKKYFSSVLTYKLDEDVNEVIYCTNSSHVENLEKWKKSLVSSAKSLNFQARESKLSKEDMVDASEFLQQLKIN